MKSKGHITTTKRKKKSHTTCLSFVHDIKFWHRDPAKIIFPTNIIYVYRAVEKKEKESQIVRSDSVK